MDFSLRCNSLKCRAPLSEQAVVTTCSHIFCLPCAESLGLSNSNRSIRTCPACNTHLTNQDDAALTNLCPTEDYKTSVLSGLNPATIIECASRAMAFWSYQTTQEIFYQEFLMKSMTEKYHSLSGQMDKLISDANSEVTALRDRINSIQHDYKELETKNAQLAEAYKKKCKDNGQLHKLYQQVKQRQVNDMMAEAAEADATNVVHAFEDFRHAEATRPHSLRAEQSRAQAGGMRVPIGTPSLAGSARTGLSNAVPARTTQRTQMAQPKATGFVFGAPTSIDRAEHHVGTPSRQPLGNLSTNVPERNTLDHHGRLSLNHNRPQQKPFHRSPTGIVRRYDGSLFGS